ncbi:MAG TPA: hypothetical protein VIC29_19655 [Steroidobacteraceae bacterium]|jgi:hypothetical protein
MKRLLTSSVALLGALLLASTAFAQGGDVAKELTTARTHAQLAEASQSVAVAKLHLHHVINCLVGPHGRGFDAAAGNPCKGMGEGAEKDAQTNHAMTTHWLDQVVHALASARRGVAAKHLADVHKAASGVVESIVGG